MKHVNVMNGHITQPVVSSVDMDEVQQSIESIENKLDVEIIAKQKTIEHLQNDIRRLHLLIEEKDKTVLELNEKLADCSRSNEGNRQLINKLLGDVDRMRQDIDWYQRTYEKRSFWGMIKEKIFFKK
ncbi:hypothetical protein [Terrimonas alba]|uniref:hypothetical protein n=1 Tax=Terrimonas alba TaxID=3349636 RepID=UPI0035F2F0FF